MSGHGKWSTISRKKGAADAKRGKGAAMMRLLEALDDHDDVQSVFRDFEPSDELLASLDDA